MMLYPLAITLILLALGQRFLRNAPLAYRIVTTFTFICAMGDLLRTLPENVRLTLNLSAVTDLFSRILPFYELGMGWVIPALAGLLLSMFMRRTASRGEAAHH